MRPILAIIPQLSNRLFLPLMGLTLLIALLAVAYNVMQLNRALPSNGGGVATSPAPALSDPHDALMTALSPLMVAVALGVVCFLWTRHAITLHAYGFFLVLGFFMATWNACLEARRRGYDANLILDMALPMLAVTVLMCRLLYVALNLNQFHSVWEVLQIWSGGLSFHGAIIGGLMVAGYYSWSRKISVGALLDLMTPSVFLGYFFGRIGCLFNGCCYGGACDLPWAMRFPDDLHRGQLTLPSHPTQIYSAILALGLFLFMQHAKKLPRFNRFHGQLTLLFLTLYAFERAFIEIFRNGATASTVFGTTWLTQAQLASAIGLVVIAVFWVGLAQRATRRQQAQPSNLEPNLPEAPGASLAGVASD